MASCGTLPFMSVFQRFIWSNIILSDYSCWQLNNWYVFIFPPFYGLFKGNSSCLLHVVGKGNAIAVLFQFISYVTVVLTASITSILRNFSHAPEVNRVDMFSPEPRFTANLFTFDVTYRLFVLLCFPCKPACLPVTIVGGMYICHKQLQLIVWYAILFDKMAITLLCVVPTT